MSNWFVDNNDWRKQAAMTAVNDLDIEKAVADQASGFVENKLGPLMKGDHPLGFEIVKKNDDNTRIVGIFAFKVGRQLLFAPVFFINGDIKGPLLYRCDTKTFVPANKEWAEYLLGKEHDEEGKGRPRTRRFENAPLVQMRRISFLPPSMLNKQASVKEKNEPVAVKTVRVKATRITGKYKADDLDKEDGPELNVEDSDEKEKPVKFAAWDDGSIRVFVDDDPTPHFLSARDAEGLLKGASAGISVGDYDIELHSNDVPFISQQILQGLPEFGMEDMLASMSKAAAMFDEPKNLLRDLMRDPVYGDVTTDCIIKAASDSPEFAERLAELCGGDPAKLFSPKPGNAYFAKQAAAQRPEESLLSIQYSQDVMTKEAAVSREFFRDGFFIKDRRPEDTLSVVYEETPSSIQQPNTPGVYAVLTNEGKLEKGVLVLHPTEIEVGKDAKERYDSIHTYVSDDHRSYKENPKLLLVKDGKAEVTTNVYAIPEQDLELSGKLSDSVSEGRVYYIVDKKSGKAVGPVGIVSIDTVDGVKHMNVVQEAGWCCMERQPRVYLDGNVARPVTYNPDLAKSDIPGGLIGSDMGFLEVKTDRGSHFDDDKTPVETALKRMKSGEKTYFGTYQVVKPEFSIGSAKSIDKFIFNRWGIPKVKISEALKGDLDTTPKLVIEAMGQKSAAWHKCTMMVKLAQDLNIAAPKAYEILDKVAANGSCEFYVDGLQKSGYALHLVDRPNFEQKFDTEFGVPMEPVQEYHLKTHALQMFEPPSAIGDAMNPTSVTGLPAMTVVTTKPENLRALADTYGLPRVFDPAVVGTLADTFNAIPLVNKYIPCIETAVDALCRLKFLYYWKTDDFNNAYGQDDMANLESQIDSEVTSLGSLLLVLLKKSDAFKKFDGSQEEDKKDQ